MKLVLASASPRRLELLASVGLQVEVDAANINEDILPQETAEEMVLRLSRAKAQAVAQRHPNDLVIAGDTTVVCQDQVLAKPLSEKEAHEMLGLLQGSWHTVLSATTVYCDSAKFSQTFCSKTEVKFVSMSLEEIKNYVATGEPMDKAGAYGIQGIGSQYIEEIRGSYTNVVGLDLARLMQVLKQAAEELVCR